MSSVPTAPRPVPAGQPQRRAPAWSPQSAAIRNSYRGKCIPKALTYSSAGFAAIVAILLGVDHLVSENSWYGTVATFLPRQPLLLIGIGLTIWALRSSTRTCLLNLAVTIVVAGPGMHFVLPSAADTSVAEGQRVKIISCNVQGFEGDYATLAIEVMRFNPDVVVLQEARGDQDLLAQSFPDWHTLWVDEFWVGSRFPLKQIQAAHSATFDRTVALTVEVGLPGQPFRLTNLHLMTPRHGFGELSPEGILGGSGLAALEGQTQLRSLESEDASVFAETTGAGQAHVICGDFNMPSFSSIYKRDWTGYANAYERANWGYGYTALCRSGRVWPPNTPWVRIDHLLASPHWKILRCDVGATDASDHRMLLTSLRLKAAPDPVPETAIRRVEPEPEVDPFSALNAYE